MTRIALLGGTPAFPQGIPFARPDTPPLADVVERLTPSYERGMLTNGPLVAEFERRAADALQVDHVVAVASCTSGLILAIRALGADGDVLLPSFTFSATAHAAAWNGLTPRFAECVPESLQLDVADARARLEHKSVGLVLATHIFGAPCPVEDVEALGTAAGAPVVFDAAHGFGAMHDGRPVGGFGAAEVFSLSPTKPVVAGEGGLVATNRADVAEAVRLGRDYGNPGDYNTLFPGLNARMSELHAALGIESLARLPAALERRRELAAAYDAALSDIPGVVPQRIGAGDLSTFKDYTIVVHPELGVTRDTLVAGLQAEGVDTRCYFDPPVHRHKAYCDVPAVDLPVTERMAGSVVSLPLFGGLTDEMVATIAGCIERIGASGAAATDAASSHH